MYRYRIHTLGLVIFMHTVSASGAIGNRHAGGPAPGKHASHIAEPPASSSAVYEDRYFGKRFHLVSPNDHTIFEVKHSESYSPHRYANGDDGPDHYSSRLSLSRNTNWGWLHFASITGPAEQQRFTGVTWGKTTLMYADGQGETYLSTENAYGGVSPFLFHGGNRLPFSFSGISVTQQMTDRIEATLGASRVRSPGVDDRLGMGAGIAAGPLWARFVEVQRHDQTAARGFDVGFVARGLRGVMRQLSSTNGASYRSVGLGWITRRGDAVGVALEHSVNPLFRDVEDTRLMFTFTGGWGGAKHSVFRQNDAEPQEPPKQFPKAMLIGGGLAAAALIASSGSSSKDDANRLAAQHNAAFTVLNAVNPTSVRENREYGGWIYRNADGSFSHTAPVRGAPAGVDIGPPSVVPAGTSATASYHTHAAFDPRFDNENFSPQDILSNRVFQVDGYLGTPAGWMKYHNLQSGEISTIRRIAN